MTTRRARAACHTQTGANVSVRNLDYNASISANGGSRAFGFVATWNGLKAVPASFTVTGGACGGGGTPSPTPNRHYDATQWRDLDADADTDAHSDAVTPSATRTVTPTVGGSQLRDVGSVRYHAMTRFRLRRAVTR